jgi:hypothetical protein
MSSYNSPLPVGSPEGTGAAAIAIAETPGGTNNVGNATDSAGNVKVDFVWGNYPMQPNDDRTDGTPVVTVAANASQNYNWNGYSEYPSARLTPATTNNHTVAEAEWNNYPSFLPGVGNYMITAATGDGTTVTYTSQNKLAAGDVVNITGLTASAYNLSSATVASADALKFTVTNSANAGEITGQWYGKVQSTTALTAYDGAGIGFIVVPSVIGETTALALDELKDAGYEAANITTATAATNAAISVTAAARTAGSTTATLTGTGAGAAFPVGTKITVASLTGDGAALNGTYTVTAVATNTVSFVSSASTVLALTGLSAGTIVGVAGTIKSQSVAAGTGSVASTATISITPYATAS